MGTLKSREIMIGLAAIFCLTAFTGCGVRGEAADPGTWGYDCIVTYDALGGMVNAREVRKTYYLPNSYVFKPSGSSNMLVEPTRDGYILAGWYTAKSDTGQNSAEEYGFSASDRWDFNIDRVQGDMTLYARWLPRAKVNYIDASSGEVLFNKNITTDSPIQELSESVLGLNTPAGKSFAGYYADPECTEEYDFSSYTHVEPTPSDEYLYARLAEMFPQYLVRMEYVEPEDDSEIDNPWLFLNKLGYQLTTDDESALAEIKAAKDQLVEEAIEAYLINTANRVVYMKFTDGNYVLVKSAADLKIRNEYGFFDTDAKGQPIEGYILDQDIDLSGISFIISDQFSGIIKGNGHKIQNLTVTAASRKLDTDKQKNVGLAKLMEGAVFNDVTFENSKLVLQINSGIDVTAGLLAAQAKNVTFNDCRFTGLTITGGKGDDGEADYLLGDLFGTADDVVLNNCTAEGLVADVREPDSLALAIFALPASEEEPANP